MRDKLCVSERRARMLDFLVKRKESTRFELASEFGVSISTIHRDIIYLSGIAPVYTKQGNQGGIYILPEFRSYKNYLTEAELSLCFNRKFQRRRKKDTLRDYNQVYEKSCCE